MELISNHYALLLGFNSPWTVTDVDLCVDKLRVEIHVSYDGDKGCCPECGSECKVYDRSAQRRWRHLDTMQSSTY